MRRKNGQFGKGYHWRKPKPFRDKKWLLTNYVVLKRSTGEIAKEFGVTDAAVLFWLGKHKIARRTVSEARKIKRWGAAGTANPMWGRVGKLNPNWRGGVTPERQDFYASHEWKKIAKAVRKRDKASCRRCGSRSDKSLLPFHVHHIVSFANKKLRGDITNLVLLCEPCHQFVHSRKNTDREYLL